MTDRELTGLLKSAVDHAAPDDLQAVLSRCGAGTGTVVAIKDRAAGRRWYRGLIAACLALVLLAGGGGGALYQRAYAVASVVSLDVNPSIELRVNRSEKVLSCAGLNADGIAVLADMNGGRDLEGAKLIVAVNAIVGAMVRSGYLDKLDSAILISVEDKDAGRGARLQQELVASVDGVLQGASSQASVLSQSVAANAALEDQARQNNISTGKAFLVEKVLQLNGELDFDALAALSVEELRDLIHTGAPGMPLGADAARQAALAWAELTESDVTFVEVDPELDDHVPCYEVELVVDGQEYDYTVDAYSGEVLSGRRASGRGASVADVPIVTAAAAAQIALERAGVVLDAGGYVARAELDGERPHYIVRFSANGSAYAYEIDACTGEVISEKQEALPAPAQDGSVNEQSAVAAALSHAGFTQEQVSRLQCEKDQEHGRVEYEIEFSCDGWEYEYTIDGETGAVLEHERDRDD